MTARRRADSEQDNRAHQQRQIDSLVDRARILSKSPYLQKEILQIRRRLGINAQIKYVIEASRAGVWIVDDRQVGQEEFEQRESERIWDIVTEDRDALISIRQLAERYDFPLAWFFQAYLGEGTAPDAAQVRARLRAMMKTNDLGRHSESDLGFPRFETEPPAPVYGIEIDTSEKGLSRIRGWQRKKLYALKLVIGPHTTKEDIAALWPSIEKLQKRLSGYRGPRQRRSQDIERDLAVYEMVRIKHMSHADAIAKWDVSHPGREYPSDPSYLSNILKRLDQRMQPRW